MAESSAIADPHGYLPLARTALLEITREDTLGEPVEVVDEGEGIHTVRFANTLPGYPGWLWTVSIADHEGDEPNVLETELLPTGDSLLAPDWVPWAERLAEYEASQEAAAHAGEHDDDDADDDDSDDDDDADDDDDDFDDDDDESDDDDADDDDDDDDDVDDDDDIEGVDVDEAAAAAGLTSEDE